MVTCLYNEAQSATLHSGVARSHIMSGHSLALLPDVKKREEKVRMFAHVPKYSKGHMAELGGLY